MAVPLEPEVAAAAMEISPPPAGSPIAESPTPGHGEAATPVKRSRERRTNDEKAGLEDIGNGIKRSVLRYSVDDALARSTQRVDKLLADLEAGWRPEARSFEKGTKWLNNPAYVLALHKVITTIWWKRGVLVNNMEALFVETANEAIDSLRLSDPSLGEIPRLEPQNGDSASRRRSMLQHLPVVQFEYQMAVQSGPTRGRRPGLYWMANIVQMKASDVRQIVTTATRLVQKSATRGGDHSLTSKDLRLLKASIPSEYACVVDFLVSAALPGQQAANLGLNRKRQHVVCLQFQRASGGILSRLLEHEDTAVTMARSKGVRHIRKATVYGMRKAAILNRVFKDELRSLWAASRDLLADPSCSGLLQVLQLTAKELGGALKCTTSGTIATPEDVTLVQKAIRGGGSSTGVGPG